MKRSKLPIGIQSFRELREDNCYYVDKTAYLQRLVRDGKHYFLSRPRRLGKSLFLDTCKELFEGNESIFKGLAIHKHWDWSNRHPVLRLSFASGTFGRKGDLERELADRLTTFEDDYAVTALHQSSSVRLSHLIKTLHHRTGERVVILIDEYDKPIIDAIEAPKIARENRDLLAGIYAILKDSDTHMRFSLITGVSKFSKVNLFSGINNLTDITIEPEYSAICGYTDRDVDTVFAPELQGLNRSDIREWYNGYSWLGQDRVYNPFDILFLFRRRQFGPW